MENNRPQSEPRDEKKPGAGAPQADQGSDKRAANVATPAAGYAAGSEGWDGTEDPTEPVLSSTQTMTQQRNDDAQSTSPRQSPTQPESGAGRPESDANALSEHSLSKSADNADDDGRFQVAEEVNLDQQSDAARKIGKMPQEKNGGRPGPDDMVDAIAKSVRPDRSS